MIVEDDGFFGDFDKIRKMLKEEERFRKMTHPFESNPMGVYHQLIIAEQERYERLMAPFTEIQRLAAEYAKIVMLQPSAEMQRIIDEQERLNKFFGPQSWDEIHRMVRDAEKLEEAMKLLNPFHDEDTKRAEAAEKMSQQAQNMRAQVESQKELMRRFIEEEIKRQMDEKSKRNDDDKSEPVPE